MAIILKLLPGRDSYDESEQSILASGGIWLRPESMQCIGISLNFFGAGVSDLRVAMEPGVSVLLIGESAGFPAGTERQNPLPSSHPRRDWDLALGISGSPGEARILAIACERGGRASGRSTPHRAWNGSPSPGSGSSFRFGPTVPICPGREDLGEECAGQRLECFGSRRPVGRCPDDLGGRHLPREALIPDRAGATTRCTRQSRVSGFDRMGHLHSFLAEFDAFVHPGCNASDRDCEGGAPIVLLPAKACGLPVLSTNHCDIPDEVLVGRTGNLSVEADPSALPVNIERIVRMEYSDRLAMSRRARAHVEAEFNLAITLPRLTETYRRVLGSGTDRESAE